MNMSFRFCPENGLLPGDGGDVIRYSVQVVRHCGGGKFLLDECGLVGAVAFPEFTYASIFFADKKLIL